MRSPRPLFYFFFLLGTIGPLLFAANLSGKGHHAPLALLMIAEVVSLGLALVFGLGQRK